MDLVLKWRHTVEGLQYFVVDVVVTLLSWGPTAIPEVHVANGVKGHMHTF